MQTLLAMQETATTATSNSFTNGEWMILVLTVLVVISLVILVPQLLKANLRKLEMLHAEHLRAIEQGEAPPPPDEAAKAAGRTALLVPMVSVISAATVTCFLVAFRNENVFAVGLAVWAVVGVVSLAAITGGVALLGRLAQLKVGIDEFEEEDQPDKSTDPV